MDRVCLRLAVLCLGVLAGCASSEPAAPAKAAPSRTPDISSYLAAIDDPSPARRTKAREGLVHLGPAAVPALAGEVKRRLQARAYGAGLPELLAVLGRLGGGEPVPCLLAVVERKDAPLRYRLDGARALRRAHRKEALPALARILSAPPREEALAVALIGCTGDFTESDAARKVLVRVLATGRDRERIEAARCLLCFDAFPLAPVFTARFFDRCWQVRLLAVDYVRRHPTPQGRAQLARTASGDRNLQVSLAARRALRRLQAK